MGMTLEALAQIARAELRGDPGRQIDEVATLQAAGPNAISFLANARYRPQLADTHAGAVIVAPDDAEACPVDCLVSDNPYLSHARVLAALNPADKVPTGIASGSVVDPTATVAESASIGPNCYIGAQVVVGERVRIGPGCVVLRGCVIGDDCQLVASVTLGTETQLGRRCLIHPGAVVGSDGFGLANDNGAWVKVPQVGRAILGDDVEVGSCTSVDRGSLGDTVLANGVKLDSQVHIAHNVQIGEHTAMAGCSAVAGSSTIGAYCTLAGAAAVSGHLELGDHVHVSAYTPVIRSLKKAGVYTGMTPAIQHADWLKNFARIRQLDDMARRIKTLEKELAALQKDNDADR